MPPCTSNSGIIRLEANQLTLKDGASIQVSSSGTGQGGNINIQVHDLIKLEGVDSAGFGNFIGSNALGSTENAGDAGSVELQAKRLQSFDGAQINTTTAGPGQGGKLVINVSEEATFSGLDHSEDSYASGIAASSNSEADNAGDAGIREPIEEVINASSEFGVSGTVVVSSPDTNISDKLLVLPKEFVDVSNQLQSPCNSRVAENLSSFSIANSEGTPNPVNDLLPSGVMLTIPSPICKNRKLSSKCKISTY